MENKAEGPPNGSNILAAAHFDVAGQVFPPIITVVRSKQVRYILGGFPTAKDFWEGVVLANYQRLSSDLSPASYFNAAQAAWHLKDWIWHEQHPGENTRSNKDHEAFEAKLFQDCPELAWIRDVADASKHCGLSRVLTVRQLPNANPICLELDDGTTYDLADVISRVINYWRTTYFP